MLRLYNAFLTKNVMCGLSLINNKSDKNHKILAAIGKKSYFCLPKF